MCANALNVTNAADDDVYAVIHNPVFQSLWYTIYVHSTSVKFFPLYFQNSCCISLCAVCSLTLSLTLFYSALNYVMIQKEDTCFLMKRQVRNTVCLCVGWHSWIRPKGTLISLVVTNSNWLPQQVLPSQPAWSVVFFSPHPAGWRTCDKQQWTVTTVRWGVHKAAAHRNVLTCS